MPPEVIRTLPRSEVQIEVAAVALGHRGPQVGSAGVRGVAGISRLDGVDPRLSRHRRRVEVGLSRREVHHVLSGGAQTHRLRHHRHRGRRRDCADPRSEMDS